MSVQLPTAEYIHALKQQRDRAMDEAAEWQAMALSLQSQLSNALESEEDQSEVVPRTVETADP